MAREPRVLILDSYAYGHKAKIKLLLDAERLTEYDVILFSPTRRGLMGTTSDKLFELVPLEQLQMWQAILGEHQRELWQFLERGGILVVFLEPLGGFTTPHTDGLIALELVAPQWKTARMRWTSNKGTSLELLDPDHPLSEYLKGVDGWQATITGGVLADDPHGYPLALSRDEQVLAYAEHLGRGSIYWLPRPPSEAQWDVLLEATASIWNDETDPLMGLYASDMDEVTRRQNEVRKQLGSEIAGLNASRREILERRRRLVAEDRTVERALQHFRAAQASSPARALDYWHRMLEVIEHDLGGEYKTREILDFSKPTGDAITNPANNKAYRARHEGGEGEQVPAGIVERARAAATEILSKFLEHRARAGPEG